MTFALCVTAGIVVFSLCVGRWSCGGSGMLLKEGRHACMHACDNPVC